MLAYRELFLAVTFSSVNIALAILIQSDHHQYRSNPNYPHQSVPQLQASLPTEQYYAKQLAGQHPTPYVMGSQIIYPYYGERQSQAQSHLMEYPTYNHFLPQHMPIKLKSYKYEQPSILLSYPAIRYPIVHRRYRRSTNPTINKISNSAIVTHDDAMASKSPLKDAKSLTVINSYLPENEPIDTDDKRVKNHQVATSNRETMGPLLLGLYPENMYREHHERDVKIKYPVATNPPTSTPTQPILLTESTREIKLAEQMKSAISQEKGQDREESRANTFSKDSTKSSTLSLASLDKTSNEIPTSSVSSHNNHNTDHNNNEYKSIPPNFHSRPQIAYTWDWLNSYDPMYDYKYDILRFLSKLNSSNSELESQKDAQKEWTANARSAHTQRKSYVNHNERLLRTAELIGAPNSNEWMQVPYGYSNYVPSTYVYYGTPRYEDCNYPYSADLDYATYGNSDSLSNLPLTTNIVEPHTVQTQQFSSTYNYPAQTGYMAPQIYDYYYIDTASI